MTSEHEFVRDFGDLTPEDVQRVQKELAGHERFAIDENLRAAGLEIGQNFVLFVHSVLQGLGLVDRAGIVDARLAVTAQVRPNMPPSKIVRALWNKRAKDWAVIETPAAYMITMQTIMENLRVDEKKPETFVSLGSGPGLYETFIGASLGLAPEWPAHRIFAVDIAPEMTRIHREILRSCTTPAGKTVTNVVPITDDMASLGLSSGMADQILCINALQWCPDWRGALREMRRIMKPDGLRCLYLVVHPHPMVICTTEGRKALELGKFTIPELLDALEAERFEPHHVRQIASKPGLGQARQKINRVFVHARFTPEAEGESVSWRTKQMRAALSGFQSKESEETPPL